MQSLDKQVVSHALQWLRNEKTIWFCTVLNTFGSSPREPGSMLVARGNGQHIGSLSGGCVEDDFIEQLTSGRFTHSVERIRYGAEGGIGGSRVSLPCGGSLEVLIERMEPNANSISHMQDLWDAIQGQSVQTRRVVLAAGQSREEPSLLSRPTHNARVHMAADCSYVDIRISPVARLIIAGVSSVSQYCAEFAQAVGFEVIVCDPRADVWSTVKLPDVHTETLLPSLFIASPNACHQATAVVALTHDPRIDDLAMMEAVRTPAFYIGVMGSPKTSRARAERLQRSGGLSAQQIARIHMPIGLALGSKTPGEIALAVMADILRVQRGKSRHDL